MANGLGYKALSNEFLMPFFEAKIENYIIKIEQFNEQAVESLTGATVKC